MKSGKTLWEELVAHYYLGVEQVFLTTYPEGNAGLSINRGAVAGYSPGLSDSETPGMEIPKGHRCSHAVDNRDWGIAEGIDV